MDNEYEQKLREQFNRVASYLNNDDSDTDRFILADWIVDFRNQKEHLTETFIREFKPFLTPSDIATSTTSTDKDFMREFSKTVYLAAECFQYKVDDNFIKEFALPTLDIDNLPPYERPFAKEYEEVLWNMIANHQKMSKNIIRRFKLMINWEELHNRSKYAVPCYSAQFFDNYKTYVHVLLENVK